MITNLSNDIAYTFTIIAKNMLGNSLESAQSSHHIPGCPV
jgi:hypothetical protein